MSETPPTSPAAERMRRHRQRRREGLRYVGIELRETEISRLVYTGYLKNDKRDNLSAIRSALYEFLDAVLE